jgi:hypothetical protein
MRGEHVRQDGVVGADRDHPVRLLIVPGTHHPS